MKLFRVRVGKQGQCLVMRFCCALFFSDIKQEKKSDFILRSNLTRRCVFGVGTGSCFDPATAEEWSGIRFGDASNIEITFHSLNARKKNSSFFQYWSGTRDITRTEDGLSCRSTHFENFVTLSCTSSSCLEQGILSQLIVFVLILAVSFLFVVVNLKVFLVFLCLCVCVLCVYCVCVITDSELFSLWKAMKTPNFEDSRRAVVEHDFLQGLNVHKWLRDLQHLHTLLNDLINKNHKSLKSLQVPFRYKGGNTLTTTTTTTAAEGGTHRSVHSRRRTCGGLKDEENSDDDDDGFSSLFG